MSESKFTASRITREFTHQVQAPPEQVFPLLCPVREYDWIPTWECQLVYAASGRAEDGCVFRTEMPDHGPAIWTVSRYEPPRRIQFVVTYPASHVEKLEIEVSPVEEGRGSYLRWTRIYTGLNEEGNALLEQVTGTMLTRRMERIGWMLDHYCRTGEMLRE
jgi:hypothetical protein